MNHRIVTLKKRMDEDEFARDAQGLVRAIEEAGRRKVEKALAAFAKWALDEVNSGNDLDTDDVYEKTVALGIAKRVTYDPEVHGEIADYREGDSLYLLTDEVKALL
jgi:tricorn protease-like protein